MAVLVAVDIAWLESCDREFRNVDQRLISGNGSVHCTPDVGRPYNSIRAALNQFTPAAVVMVIRQTLVASSTKWTGG